MIPLFYPHFLADSYNLLFQSKALRKMIGPALMNPKKQILGNYMEDHKC